MVAVLVAGITDSFCIVANKFLLGVIDFEIYYGIVDFTSFGCEAWAEAIATIFYVAAILAYKFLESYYDFKLAETFDLTLP